MNASETRIYGFRVPAGGMFPLPVQGDNFLIKSASGPVNVRWPGGFLENLAAGQGQNIPDGFSRLDFTNSAGIEVYGEVLISDENFIDKRITGDVSVIDGEKARTLAGGRLMACPSASGGVPDFPLVQLWNPSTDKNLIVTGLALNASYFAGNAFAYVYGQAVALTNDVSASNVGNALLGEPVGVAEARTETVTVFAPSVTGRIYLGAMSPSITDVVALSGPIVVPPSKGLTVAFDKAGSLLAVNFQWFEEAVV